MAKKPRPPANPKRVDRLQHKDSRRTNIPTQENSSFMHDEDVAPVPLEFPRRFSPTTHPELYKRNQDLDPQLVWRGNSAGEGDVQLVWKGKDEEDAAPLTVDAAPIYIQEKVHPKAIIDDIRRRQKGAEDWKYESDAPDLFADFNGIPEIEDKLKYYEHDAVGLKWSNRLILGDSLAVMASLAEKEGLRAKVQMIYLDPPYGIKFNSNWQVSTKDRDVRDGNITHLSREAEVVRAFRDTWARGIHSYLSHLRDRVVASRDLLAETGAIFVQIGDENLHLVRSLLDEVFGPENFVAQISVKKTSGATSGFIPGTVDFLLMYAKSVDKLKYRQMYLERQLGDDGDATYTFRQLDVGLRKRLTPDQIGNLSANEREHVFRLQTLSSQAMGREKGEGAASWFPVAIAGREIRPSMSARWKTNEAGMQRLQRSDRVAATGQTISYVRFHGDFPVFPVTDLWTDTQSGSAMEKIYVVQTSTKIVERCMLMTTDPGDLVLARISHTGPPSRSISRRLGDSGLMTRRETRRPDHRPGLAVSGGLSWSPLLMGRAKRWPSGGAQSSVSFAPLLSPGMT